MGREWNSSRLRASRNLYTGCASSTQNAMHILLLLLLLLLLLPISFLNCSSSFFLPSKSIYTSCLCLAQKTPDVFTPKADHHNNNNNNNNKNCPEFPSPQFLTCCLSSLASPKPTIPSVSSFFLFSFFQFSDVVSVASISVF